jgi:hypothetical protein
LAERIFQEHFVYVLNPHVVKAKFAFFQVEVKKEGTPKAYQPDFGEGLYTSVPLMCDCLLVNQLISCSTPDVFLAAKIHKGRHNLADRQNE